MHVYYAVRVLSPSHFFDIDKSWSLTYITSSQHDDDDDPRYLIHTKQLSSGQIS